MQVTWIVSCEGGGAWCRAHGSLAVRVVRLGKLVPAWPPVVYVFVWYDGLTGLLATQLLLHLRGSRGGSEAGVRKLRERQRLGVRQLRRSCLGGETANVAAEVGVETTKKWKNRGGSEANKGKGSEAGMMQRRGGGWGRGVKFFN